ncbi:LOW QUALITY PROTEIN: taste receptor type 1 member 1-like [Boleophthalmus pectinirostris]|uniref:LOW QUALITY PROTEIN: taste receptor type 1 member 1-like n=1 Tax=Boleophthalmus pectinirostris TaxID=150288 RepID=UPI00242D473C|nr:LOW QUALITY PROTEIN: taste receptor type 1 member 1-like [Boleophthalmus pectinirostris]
MRCELQVWADCSCPLCSRTSAGSKLVQSSSELGLPRASFRWDMPGTSPEGGAQEASGGSIRASEFYQEGDFVIGGLFNIHGDDHPQYYNIPEALQCSGKKFYLSSYRRFQMMRFTIEQINNSSLLLPGVTLGYNIFDHCSDTQNIPGVFHIFSGKHPIRPWSTARYNVSKVIAVVGTYTSPESRTVAPMFMAHLIPMISYGAASSIFSMKDVFPSFFRTLHPNKDMVEVIVQMLLYFKWHWVAFLNVDNDYGNDSRTVFLKMIQGTSICLAYNKKLNENTNYRTVFEQIENQKIQVIIVFATEVTIDQLIPSAIQINVTNKTWIAVDAWALNKNLPKLPGIKNIGTVIGIAEPVISIPGFDEFIRYLQIENQPGEFCNQFCNCSDLTPDDILSAENSFNFPVYVAVYAIAHALHNILQCGDDKCNKNITVYPHMVLSELKRSKFTLLNHTIEFDQNGDPTFGDFDLITWNSSGAAETVGLYTFQSEPRFSINQSKIQWHTNGQQVPLSQCSPECLPGYRRSLEGSHKCCFKCVPCQKDEYINVSVNPYKCVPCGKTEWSPERSTSCKLRSVEFIPFEDAVTIMIIGGTVLFVVLSLLTAVLFGLNYNTPVVKSAGGPMCFLILGCLSLCSISVFFYFGKPTTASCILRYLPFLQFSTACLACFVVRSFQIVYIFKIAAQYPMLHRLWIKYHGQWLVVMAIFMLQGTLLLIVYTSAPPQPQSDTNWYKDKIILSCGIDLKVYSPCVTLLVLLCFLSFIVSYMGKDLPKNYNEAKTITFCLCLLILTWILYSTIFILYRGKYIQTVSALAILSSLYSFLLWYFCPKCYIIRFQPEKNTQQYFQGLIKTYIKTQE